MCNKNELSDTDNDDDDDRMTFCLVNASWSARVRTSIHTSSRSIMFLSIVCGLTECNLRVSGAKKMRIAQRAHTALRLNRRANRIEQSQRSTQTLEWKLSKCECEKKEIGKKFNNEIVVEINRLYVPFTVSGSSLCAIHDSFFRHSNILSAFFAFDVWLGASCGRRKVQFSFCSRLFSSFLSAFSVGVQIVAFPYLCICSFSTFRDVFFFLHWLSFTRFTSFGWHYACLCCHFCCSIIFNTSSKTEFCAALFLLVR